MIIIFLIIPSLAHSGRTDSQGGHHNNKNEGYHYHSGNKSVYKVIKEKNPKIIF